MLVAQEHVGMARPSKQWKHSASQETDVYDSHGTSYGVMCAYSYS